MENNINERINKYWEHSCNYNSFFKNIHTAGSAYKTAYNKTDEIIDLTNLNIFDAANKIVMISTNNLTHNISQKIKCKVASSDITDLLKNFNTSKDCQLNICSHKNVLTNHFSPLVCSLSSGKFGTLLSGSWDTTAKVWLYAKCPSQSKICKPY